MELHVYESLPSTNRTAHEAALGGAREFYTVVAREQTAGRGRLTRSFYSPVGGTYFSTVLRPTLSITDFGRITPVAAVAVHRALLDLTGVKTEIKWVNDLLLDGKKVCGILAESGTDRNGKPFVILGIGINTAKVTFPDELRDKADFVPYHDSIALIKAILNELAFYEQSIKAGNWLSYYSSHCAFLGEDITVIKEEKIRHGTALDILEDGALRVRFENGSIEELRGGEISLRSAQIRKI